MPISNTAPRTTWNRGTPNDGELFRDEFQALYDNDVYFNNIFGSIQAIKDEDDMASNSNLALASQQSIKQYVDSRESYRFTNIYNCQLSNNAIDESNDIDIQPGKCWSSNLTTYMTLPTTMTKRLDAAWAVGSGNGGLFSGIKTINMTYHVFLIKRASDGVVDVGFDTSVTADNIPSGWTSYRRLGSFKTNAAAIIRPFKHIWQDKYFMYRTKSIVVNLVVPATPTLYALDVPTGVEVCPVGLFTCGLPTDGTKLIYNIYNPLDTPPALTDSSIFEGSFMGVAGSGMNSGSMSGTCYQLNGTLPTDNLGQLYFVRLGEYFSEDYYNSLHVMGWKDITL